MHELCLNDKVLPSPSEIVPHTRSGTAVARLVRTCIYFIGIIRKPNGFKRRDLQWIALSCSFLGIEYRQIEIEKRYDMMLTDRV